MNPVIIIPAYNPPKNFKNLIIQINKLYKINIIIVDDGSSSNIKIEFDNILILKNKLNRGKGYSLKKAMKLLQ